MDFKVFIKEHKNKDWRRFAARKCNRVGDRRYERFEDDGFPKIDDEPHAKSKEETRVAMDFTGAVGRIVEDPIEIQAISDSCRNPKKTSFSVPSDTLTFYSLQPWFYRGLSREKATHLIGKYGRSDGVFLVRSSSSLEGTYVLTYKHSNKVHHTRISRIMDRPTNLFVYTIDRGLTKFHDLTSLVHFYNLNQGCLLTRLTQYVAPSSSTMSLEYSPQESNS